MMKDHQAEKARLFARQCRVELAIDLAKLMTEDHANTTSLVVAAAHASSSSSCNNTTSTTQARMKKRADEAFQEIKSKLPPRSTTDTNQEYERLLALTICNLLAPFTTIRKSNIHRYSTQMMELERDRVLVYKSCNDEIKKLVRCNFDGKRQLKTSRSLRKQFGINLARLMVDDNTKNIRWN